MHASYPDGRRSRRKPSRSRPNVLVVAPHPDDDAIGCGATLARLAARGARVAVTYVTDGSASHIKSERFPPKRLRDVREDEARAALRCLGIWGEPQFLRAPDGGLARLGVNERQRLIDAVAARIARLRANIVFAPWPRDPHPDHVVTAQIVHAALAICGCGPSVYWYGVWLPVRGTESDQPAGFEATVCDIPLTLPDLERKRAAILAHRSQTGALIEDDPEGFCITADMLETWLTPVERFYRLTTS